MGSSEGEAFSLREPVVVEGPVEAWMTAVENEMSKSLRSITKEGVYRYANEERQEWITRVIGMVSLVGSQIWWTWEVRHQKRLLICMYTISYHININTKLHLTVRLTMFGFDYLPTAPHLRSTCVFVTCLAVQRCAPGRH